MTLPDLPKYYAFNADELIKVVAQRQPYSDIDVDVVLEFILRDSLEMITSIGYSPEDTKIDFLRKDGIPLWGSGRIPLNVRVSDLEFVLKPYDVHDPNQEKMVLEHLQRSRADIAPEVYWIGDKGYAEEFSANGKSLTEIAEQDGIQSAVHIGAEMHARLAQLGINYNHNHWLDEFHVGEKGHKVLDFGTAQLYQARGSSPEFDARLEKLDREGVESVLQADHMDHRYWVDGSLYGVPFRFRMDVGAPKVEQALLVGKTSEERLNILVGWYSAGLGIAKHFLNTTHRFNSEGAVRATMEVMPTFLESFCATYGQRERQLENPKTLTTN